MVISFGKLMIAVGMGGSRPLNETLFCGLAGGMI